jgi:hypothetical protein
VIDWQRDANELHRPVLVSRRFLRHHR